MGFSHQLFEGSIYLAISSVFHAVVLMRYSSFVRRKLPTDLSGLSEFQRIGILISLLFVIILAHTVEVWLWAYALHNRDAIQNWNAAIYFSMVTYASLGYGDIVLGPDARIFAAMASFAGLLNFGLSTAVLVGSWTRLFNADWETAQNSSEER